MIPAVAVYFLFSQPACMAEVLNPFSTENLRSDNYKSGIFIMPISSKDTKQEKSKTTTTAVYTSPSAVVITSPQINIQPLPAVPLTSAGTETAIVSGSVPQINDLTKTAVDRTGETAAPLSGDSANKKEDEILLPPEAGEEAGFTGEEDGSQAGVLRTAGETGQEEAFYSSPGKREMKEAADDLPAGKPEVEQVRDQGQDSGRVRLEMADEGRLRQDYLAAFLQAGGEGRTALRAAARREKGGGNEDERFYFESDGDSDDEESGYAGYYYNVEMSGEGGTSRPGEGKRRKKIIEPLKELFYKVSYFSKKER